FLFTAFNRNSEKTGIYVADLNSKNESKDRRLLVTSNTNAAYAAPGYLVFALGKTLMAQPFDAAKGQLTGEAMHIAEDIETYGNSAMAEFSVSQNGVLAYTTGGLGSILQLTWLDRSGKPLGTIGTPGDLSWPRISPDGRSVAYQRRDAQTNAKSDV